MQPSIEYTSIPRGVQPSLLEDLSLVFTTYFVQQVKESANYKFMERVDWWSARCQLLHRLYEADIFTTATGICTRDIVAAWGWASRCPYIFNFLEQVAITPLFLQVCEVLCAHELFAGYTLIHFVETFKQTWFGLHKWESVPPGRYIKCGFHHVYIGELDSYMVRGLHYWGTYYLGEQQSQIIFDRTLKKHTNIHLASIRFYWNGAVKPYGTILFGCPTEFEILIFFCAFILGSNQRTSFQIDGQQVHVRCYDKITRTRTTISRELVTAYFEY